MCWDLMDEGGTRLAPLTKCILAKVCHCSYSFVHNKTRIQLSSARATSMVYNLYIWFK